MTFECGFGSHEAGAASRVVEIDACASPKRSGYVALATNHLHHGKYKLTRFVYCENFDHPRNAIVRKQRIKLWRREKAVALICSPNPEWRDQSNDAGNILRNASLDFSTACDATSCH